MKLKKVIVAVLAILLLTGSSIDGLNAQTSAVLTDEKIASIFKLEKKYLENTFKTVETTGKMPRSTMKGFQPISDWTSGFYAGNLWLVYEFTKDKSILKKAEYTTQLLEDNKNYTHDHDIGFMIYCSYGNGYRLTKNEKYKDVIVDASKTAIKRYNPKVKSIMSWEPSTSRDWKFPVIIDNMINLELLLNASGFSGDSTYYHVAINHANTTMKNQYRADYSCSHVVDYDPKTGKMRKRDWNNGDSNPGTAAWSRGQSWGLYGFGFMYKYTGKKAYLAQAENVAAYILNNPNMPEDMVPYWDYRAPKYPTMRDASAAALLASGLMQLAELSPANGKRYFTAGEKILESLSSAPYLNERGEGDYLLKHATGNFLRESEVDGGLIYADYYFLEALLRYQNLKGKFAATPARKQTKEKLIFKSDFSGPLDSNTWVTEIDKLPGHTSRVYTVNNALVLDTWGGVTVWLNKKLSGNLQIEYERVVRMDKGGNDRLGDLNQFWMATDPKRTDVFTRRGKFEEYDDLSLYYVGVGGHFNTTTRFRKYLTPTSKPVIKEYTDKKYLLEADKVYQVKIIVKNGTSSFWMNGECWFSYADPNPLTSGYFGFRSLQSRQEIRNLRIYALD